MNGPTVGIATGAGSGIGQTCAQRLADRVDTLFLVDRDGAALRGAAESLAGAGSRATVEQIELDITDGDGLASLAARAAERGVLRAVTHAAGISPAMGDWRRILLVDLVGTAMLAEAMRPLARAGTAMVFIASMAPQLQGVAPDVAADAAIDAPLDAGMVERIHEALGPSVEDPATAYSWAKRGVQRFVQAEAVRLGRYGARVCSISPGAIDTAMGRQESAESGDGMRVLVERSPVGRMGRPEEIAAAAAFLLSDEASYITGIDLLVDGGIVAAVRGPAVVG